MKIMRTILIVSSLMAVWRPACAQIGVSGSLSATADKVTSTNYYFARPNDLTIIVNVVGFVQRPGRYEIASTIDLINLISLAGGPTNDGALDDVTVTRTVKTGEKINRNNLRINLEDLKTYRTSDLLLEPGDVVTVDRTGWSSFRDGFGMVVSGAMIITAIAQIILVMR